MSALRTRVFDLASEYGFGTNAELAQAMGIDQSLISRIRSGERPVTRAFIVGALRAFPDKVFEDLFTVDSGEPMDAAS